MAGRGRTGMPVVVSRYSDVVMAAAVVMVLVMMVVPLHRRLLDILLTFNLTFSLTVMLVTMYTTEPLQFSVFPSLLLVATLFRLALNVSSTRLILLYADAGDVIRRFGEFVVGGNPLVGLVIFLILVVIQFIVITRGAERVAEVAARFTLDGMPGKQMSIDADLNAGLITDKEALARRREIEREADFYGAMDGASKFVKGDAIAAVVITLINIIGGLAAGVLQKGMSLDMAVKTYTLLTVGDGLVTQIPALLISTATGIIVTRAASEANLGTELVEQVLSQPKVLFVGTGVLLGFALLPGLPRLPFLVLAAVLGWLAYTMNRAARETSAAEADEAKAREADALRKPENVLSLLAVDPMEIELGYGLIPLADVNQQGELLDRIVMIRRQCALDLGLVVPPIRIRDNVRLKPNAYVLKVRGVEVAQGELLLDRYLAMNPGTVSQPVEGIETREPVFGLPAVWVTEEQKDRAELAGYTVVDPPSVLATHLTETIKKFAHVLLGRQEVQSLIDAVKTSYPAVVEELVPNIMSVGEIQKVLQNLLREGVSIRDLVTVLETLADYGRATKDPDLLTEYVRQALGRSICRQLQVGAQMSVVTLDPKLEKVIVDSVERRETGAYLALEPDLVQRMMQSLQRETQKIAAKGHQPIVLCSPLVRLYLRRLTEKFAPNLVILSFNEVDPCVEVQAVGVVSV